MGGAAATIPFAIGGIDLGETQCPEYISFNESTNEWTIQINGKDINLGDGGPINGSNRLRVLLVYLIKNNATKPYLDALNHMSTKLKVPESNIINLVNFINNYILDRIIENTNLSNGINVTTYINSQNLIAGIMETYKKKNSFMGGGKKKKSPNKKKKRSKNRCKKCRCKPCLCNKDIHCYKITCNTKKKKKKKKSKKGGGTKHKQNWKKNQGIFGPMMKKNKLVRDEICHNCTISAYEKGARRFCKTHKKVWDRKTNSCRIKKKKKSKNK